MHVCFGDELPFCLPVSFYGKSLTTGETNISQFLKQAVLLRATTVDAEGLETTQTSRSARSSERLHYSLYRPFEQSCRISGLTLN